MKDCLFCDIVSGKVSSYTLFEDETIKVIMDAFPNDTGHTLIIPKKHYKDLDDIDIEVLKHIMEEAKVVKKVLEKVLNPSSIILINNTGDAQKIKHFHLHLIPKYDESKKLSLNEVYDLLKDEF